jgi:hypothetical protein
MATDEHGDEHGPDSQAGPARSQDAAWEQIVAQLRRDEATSAAPWPDAEGLDTTPQDTGDDEPSPALDSRPDPSSPRPVIIWRGSEKDIDAELDRAIPDEHFVPPEPPPLPRADAITWAAWIGVIGGPLLLLALTALGRSSSVLVGFSAAAFLGGFAVLITRMRSQRDPYDPDDGAVV